MFSQDDLQKLVSIAGQALEIEDHFIAGCVATNPDLYGDGRPQGILRINNERYYQFLIIRSLMSGFPYRVEPERDTHDIALYADKEAKDYAALGELKRWMSSTGEVEIPALRRDIEKLKVRSDQCPAFLLIVTASPPGQTQQDCEFLGNRLGISLTQMTVPYVFLTSAGRHGFAEVAVFAFFI